MNSAEILRRLYRERQEWKVSGDGVEVGWVVRGLDIALRLVHAQAKEERSNARKRRPRLSRWAAADLFQAVTQALAHLSRADRARAIAVLEKAKISAESTKKL
jgi:hypothetical protein